ncbi:hypothetical protein [Tsukamurella sp. 1534]|uniref:MinD/ParA family ATP-binding protein n=1 Tax=Tsukamurella sp. 1534 TaxID=1151061 RepID=UPI00131F222B|nr:hypothetical protein [Tsukamurella sp. 1534]
MSVEEQKAAADGVAASPVPQAATDLSARTAAPTMVRPGALPAEPGGPAAPATTEWEEPDLPDVEDIDNASAGAVPAAQAPAAIEVAVVKADDRPTAEQPKIVDEPAAEAIPAAAKPPAPAQAGPAAPAAAQTVPVPAPAQPQWQGQHQQQSGPFHQPGFGAGPAAQFQQAQASGQIQRPPMPMPFGQPGVPGQAAPAQAAPGQHQAAPMHQAQARPMGDSVGAPMSTASSTFNQQIKFSDASVRVSGWRAWLKRVGIDVGPSANEQEHAELVHRIRVPKNKFHVTGVFADSAGGTLLVGVLGQILERTRADNVVALDLDPDGGDLDQVTAWHQGGSTARTLIQQADLSDRNQVDKHLAVTPTNLHVLPTPWRFNGRDVTDYDDVLDLYSIFRPHYSLALVDAGRGLQTVTGTGVLEISSALILPASATTRGVRKVAATIDWLRHHGWHGLLANTIVVINHTKRRGSVSVEQFDELFRAGQKLRVHEIPYDPHLDSDTPIDLDMLRKRTIRAFEELAADLADNFNSGYEPPAAQKLAELQQARAHEGR